MGDKTQLHGFYCYIVIGAIHIAPIAIAPISPLLYYNRGDARESPIIV